MFAQVADEALNLQIAICRATCIGSIGLVGQTAAVTSAMGPCNLWRLTAWHAAESSARRSSASRFFLSDERAL